MGGYPYVQDETEIPVEVLVPQTMPVEEVKERVTKIVSDILNGKGRRDLAFQPYFSVYTGETTETECAANYSTAVDCYDAIIMIGSKEDLMDRFME